MTRRGDVVIADLDPSRGSDSKNRRLVVVVSNDGANAVASQLGRSVVTVVPLTSSTARVYPFQALVPAAAAGLRQDSKTQAEQVRSVDMTRLGAPVSHLPADVMEQIDQALRLHLAL